MSRSSLAGSGFAPGRRACRSLQTWLDEPDWSNASFLLSVMGEGSFLSMPSFLERHAPDRVTARVARLAITDEARHVAFSTAHLEEHVTADPAQQDRLRAGIERRHDALANIGRLSPAVHNSLVLLAAGGWAPAAIQAGWDAVQALQADMDEGRQRRLIRLGFTDQEAVELSALHTNNFMRTISGPARMGRRRVPTPALYGVTARPSPG